MPGIYGVPVGVIQSATLLCPSQHYFATHKVEWFEIADLLPRYGGESGMDKLDE